MSNLAFNESFYLTSNPDVAAAISKGQFTNARAHFDTFGRFEGRNPNAFFDVTYYLTANPDVANARVNPLDHFLAFGAREGRFANNQIDAAIDSNNNNLANEFNGAAYLAANPDLQAAGFTAANVFSHYELFGQFESRPGVALTNGTALTGPFSNTGSGAGAGAGTAGTIFTLTAGADLFAPNASQSQFQSTGNNDTFRGLAAGDLASADSINGGNGIDTLTAVLGATAVVPVLTSVEVVNLTSANNAASFSGASSTGIQTITSQASATTLAIGGITTATTVGLVGDTGGTTVTFTNVAGAADTANFSVSGSVVGDVLTANGVETANIRVDAASSFTFTDANLVSAVITGTGGLTLDITNGSLTNVTSVDATALNGGLTLTETVLGAANFTVNGGTGNDVIALTATTTERMILNGNAGNDVLTGGVNNDTINGGTGNDVITGNAGADNITLGAGNDVVTFLLATDSTGATAATIDIITDFKTSGADILNFAALAPTIAGAADLIAAQNAVTALAAGSTLAQAAQAAFGATTTNVANTAEVVYFQFGGNTYVGVDTVGSGNTFTAGTDLLVQLTGNVALTTADFQIA